MLPSKNSFPAPVESQGRSGLAGGKCRILRGPQSLYVCVQYIWSFYVNEVLSYVNRFPIYVEVVIVQYM